MLRHALLPALAAGCLLIPGLKAGAASSITVKQVPMGTLDWVKDSSQMKLNWNTLESVSDSSGTQGGYKWQVHVGKHPSGEGRYTTVSIQTQEGMELPATIRRPDGKPLSSLEFHNVGKIGERDLNCLVEVMSVYVGCYRKNGDNLTQVESGGVTYDSKSFLSVTSALGFGHTGYVDGDGNTVGAIGCADTEARFTFTYADTGEVVEKPFIQSSADVDIGYAHGHGDVEDWSEGMRLSSGYSMEAWVYPDCELRFDGDLVCAPEGGVNNEGDDSYIKDGCLLPTKTGRFTLTGRSGGTYGWSVRLYQPYNDQPAPVESTSVTKVTESGTPGKLTVRQGLVTGMWSAMVPVCNSLAITDTLPDGFTYGSAKVTQNGKDVTASQGTLKFDSGARTVFWTVKPELLTDPAFLDGGDFILEISGTWDSPGGRADKSTDYSITVVDGLEYPSNTVAVEFRCPVTADATIGGKVSVLGGAAEYLPSTGKPAGGGAAGIRAVPDKGYYLASVSLNEKAYAGPSLSGGDLVYTGGPLGKLGVYAFHAEFKPLPELSVSASLPSGFSYPGRCPGQAGDTFLFKVSGTDVFGVSHIWYLALDPGEGKSSWKQAVSPGKYEVSFLGADQWGTDKGAVSVDMSDGSSGAAAFRGDVLDYKNWTHNDLSVNRLVKR